MSSKHIRRHLTYILEAISTIQSFLADTPDLATYSVDRKTRSAVERQLQILTEAAYRLGDEASFVCPGPDWSGLRGMGNLLRHAYHRVNDRVVWDTVKEDLPAISQQVSASLLALHQQDDPA